MITDLIDKLCELVTDEYDAKRVQIRLASIRLDVQELIEDHKKLRQRCAELEKDLHQEIVRRNQTTEMIRAHLPPETISTKVETKRSTPIKSRLKKPTAKKSKKYRDG